MNKPLTLVNQPRIGTCPHGLPMGACPICNGMGGGGGASSKKLNSPKEMSWSECYSAWQKIIQAKDLAKQRQEITPNSISFTAGLANFSQKIANISEKLANFVQNTQSLPKIISTPLKMIAKITIPILNTIQNLSDMAKNAINFAKEKFADISEKLNAIFGELKNSIENKISEKLKDFKKKFKSIFGIFEPEDIVDDEKQIEEAKRKFELKTVLTTIKEKFKRKEELNGESSN